MLPAYLQSVRQSETNTSASDRLTTPQHKASDQDLVVTSAPDATGADTFQPTFPIRAAFYYPWFPEAWTQEDSYPYSNFTPTIGYYGSDTPQVITRHIDAMQYGNIDAGLASWWGIDHPTDKRLEQLLAVSSGTTFRWAAYYEREGQGNPPTYEIAEDLAYLRDHHAADPSYLRVDGQFVVFVYADRDDSCEMVDRWGAMVAVDVFMVLKVFDGYRACESQPDSWHQYAPAQATDSQSPFSFSISPGFWKFGEAPRLERSVIRWEANVRQMVASGADFQLITTFNEWGEGTAVESAEQWSSDSGFGDYLDVLHEID